MTIGAIADQLRARVAGVRIDHETRPGRDRALAHLHAIGDGHCVTQQCAQPFGDADLVRRIHLG